MIIYSSLAQASALKAKYPGKQVIARKFISEDTFYYFTKSDKMRRVVCGVLQERREQ